MNNHEGYDPIPFTSPSDIERIFGEQARIGYEENLEKMIIENKNIDIKKPTTHAIYTYCNGPIWESLCGIFQDSKKSENQTTAMKKNLEIYNLLINGHDGNNLPPIARKVHNDWDNNIDLYPSY